MSDATFSYPTSPLVAKNPFRRRNYERQSLLPFAEARSLLPEPVLPSRPEWVEMYWRAWELAWLHLRRPHAGSGFVADFIGSATDDHIHLWDSSFMVQFGVYGRRAFNFMGTLDNFYAKQHEDGQICREIDVDEGSDFFSPFDPNGAGPNVLAWAEWRVFRHTNDEERIGQIIWPLLALHNWYQAHRTWPSGLYWATGLSSGMPNQPRVPDSRFHHRHWTWVDANMQASLSCQMLAQMAAAVDEAQKHAKKLVGERAFLLRDANAHLWNDKSEFYHDVDPAGNFSAEKSIGAYWALLDKDMVPQERLTPFVRHLHETTAFNRPHRVPSLSSDSPGYDKEGNGWCGGVWSPTNYMVLKGLRRHGRHKLAHQIALNHLNNVCQIFQRSNTFWEHYTPEQAAPGTEACSDFVGWSGLTPISILLEDVIGLSVDWPLRRVTWDRRLESASAYGVRNYPLGAEGKMDITGNGEAVEVVTNVPFTLTVREREETLQTAITAGAHTIEL
ncbi:MAG: trehalase family glycosidase [Candidatus Promineifilaceae bacterium]|nr:trehalase family glycosidase [Candidatus Promineifilaceae bacterium]